ncbi:plasmid stabilization system protein ParE [Marinilabilia salmonicolor]|jgi:plasmid stabilization system protein ParE|uniref:type II toxin-antitoxin system RelE/ParE family toxin n=1 Tax=Marinilabilia salmonicolor TaxID=989 RepID=UPI000D066524|nr:type II toxin-antitoxin system RelE/ParE family toxin [Marinilabilia salmonicolor]PRZ01023.1 plasmid stabilization system protein ParE [Marinilabilia salmonicolor]
MGNYKIIWSFQAKQDLKDIYEYWKKKSVQGAKNVRSDILKSPKTIFYAKQYQVDDINPKYRRIIVRTFYKVLYREQKHTISIMGVVCTSQSPDVLKNK